MSFQRFEPVDPEEVSFGAASRLRSTTCLGLSFAGKFLGCQLLTHSRACGSNTECRRSVIPISTWLPSRHSGRSLNEEVPCTVSPRMRETSWPSWHASRSMVGWDCYAVIAVADGSRGFLKLHGRGLVKSLVPFSIIFGFWSSARYHLVGQSQKGCLEVQTSCIRFEAIALRVEAAIRLEAISLVFQSRFWEAMESLTTSILKRRGRLRTTTRVKNAPGWMGMMKAGGGVWTSRSGLKCPRPAQLCMKLQAANSHRIHIS